MKYFLAALLFFTPMFSCAMSIDSSKGKVESDLVEFSKSIIPSETGNVKTKLSSPNFAEGDEYGFDAKTPRYTFHIEDDLRLKIDTSENGSEIYRIWLQYPKNRENAPEVISMKKAALYIANKSLYKNKKTFGDYQKFMNKTSDSKGRVNYKKMHGYAFLNGSCSYELYCITIEGS